MRSRSERATCNPTLSWDDGRKAHVLRRPRVALDSNFFLLTSQALKCPELCIGQIWASIVRVGSDYKVFILTYRFRPPK